jgi:DNA-binding IclR family transcriptional regulator
VITLVALGYLKQGAPRKYRLGLRVTDLGMSALNSTGLREHAHPYLEELCQPGYLEQRGPCATRIARPLRWPATPRRFPSRELVDALGPHLRSTADRISARVGYRRDDETHGGR